jgi:hypothetical protein
MKRKIIFTFATFAVCLAGVLTAVFMPMTSNQGINGGSFGGGSFGNSAGSGIGSGQHGGNIGGSNIGGGTGGINQGAHHNMRSGRQHGTRRDNIRPKAAMPTRIGGGHQDGRMNGIGGNHGSHGNARHGMDRGGRTHGNRHDNIRPKAMEAQCASSAHGKPLINVYKTLNDYHIDFFEKNVVKKPVVSQYSKEQLEKMAAELGVDFFKVRVLLVAQELLAMNGEKKELSEINKMNNVELSKLLYGAKNEFFKSLSEEQKKTIEKEYKEWKKGKRAEATVI